MTLPSTVAALALMSLLAATPAAAAFVDLASEDLPMLTGQQAEDLFGYSIAVADFDDDGVPDLAVGAPGLAHAETGVHTGAVYVFTGATIEGLSGAASRLAVTLPGAWERGRFGTSLAAGDFDGDGSADLAVGAPSAGAGDDVARGTVSVYFGARTWVDGTSPDVVVVGLSSGGRFGTELLARDLDGDGADELLVAAPLGGSDTTPGPGEVFLMDGVAMRAAVGLIEASAASSVRIVGEKPGDSLSTLACGDVDGDGAVELVLGAHLADGPEPELIDAGRLYVVPAERFRGADVVTLSSPGVWTTSGQVERGYFGRSISVDDIDFDGADDILVSACASKLDRDKVEATGEAHVLFGAEAFFDSAIDILDEDVPRFRSRARWDLFGLPVLLADLSGDFSADVIVASQFSDAPDGERERCGEVYVFRGSLRSVVAAKAGGAELAEITVIGGKSSDSIGAALVAADLSGDGRPELIIGAPDSPGELPGGGPRRGRVIVVPGEMFSH